MLRKCHGQELEGEKAIDRLVEIRYKTKQKVKRTIQRSRKKFRKILGS